MEHQKKTFPFDQRKIWHNGQIRSCAILLTGIRASIIKLYHMVTDFIENTLLFARKVIGNFKSKKSFWSFCCDFTNQGLSILRSWALMLMARRLIRPLETFSFYCIYKRKVMHIKLISTICCTSCNLHRDHNNMLVSTSEIQCSFEIM